MKTLTRTLLATAFLAILFVAPAFTAAASQIKKHPLTITNPLTFNKIRVNGNVKIILIQKDQESVGVYEDYDTAEVSIKRFGYTLVINSTAKEQVVIAISLKDLHRIDASGNAMVITERKLNLKFLQIFLKDSAVANVNTDAGSLYTMISGKSDLRLSGSCGEHTLVKNNSSRLNIDKFASVSTIRTSTDSVFAVNAVKGK